VVESFGFLALFVLTAAAHVYAVAAVMRMRDIGDLP